MSDVQSWADNLLELRAAEDTLREQVYANMAQQSELESKILLTLLSRFSRFEYCADSVIPCLRSRVSFTSWPEAEVLTKILDTDIVLPDPHNDLRLCFQLQAPDNAIILCEIRSINWNDSPYSYLRSAIKFCRSQNLQLDLAPAREKIEKLETEITALREILTL